MIPTARRLLTETGQAILFLIDILKTAVHTPPSMRAVLEQVWSVTVQSLSTTALAGFFVGAIMTIQFTMQVEQFGALGYLGGLATSATVREVGPLLIAFMLSGKVGAFTSAELGTMRVTEQIDAIRCLGADPLRELVLPRFIAIVVASFFLLATGLIMSVFGGLALGIYFSGISSDEYLRYIPEIVTWPSILTGLFKCFVFAFVLAVICTFKGYQATGGARGVGLAVVQTAVATMVSLVIADFLTSLIAGSAIKIAMGI